MWHSGLVPSQNGVRRRTCSDLRCKLVVASLSPDHRCALLRRAVAMTGRVTRARSTGGAVVTVPAMDSVLPTAVAAQPRSAKRKAPPARSDKSESSAAVVAAEVVPPPTPEAVEGGDETLVLDEDEDGMDGADEEAAEAAAAASAAPRGRRVANRNAISYTHPRGVKPLGNQLFDSVPSIRPGGFGLLGRMYTDSALLELIRSHLGAEELVALNRTSRALYILANEEELWRDAVLARWAGDFRFVRDWKNTYAHMLWLATQPTGSKAVFAGLPQPLKFGGFFSDEVFQSFYCAHIDLQCSYGDASGSTKAVSASAAAPSVRSRDNIPRIPASEMTSERFRREFGVPNRPVIITGLMDSWPCYSKAPEHDKTRWNVPNWLEQYGDTVFKIGRFTMPLRAYFEYMHAVESDESPLYLFDSRFAEKVPAMREQYEVPEYFRNDFFNLLEGESTRPAFRWILVGPARSGSTFHKDPNHTSAWNALISGEKLWIMSPPDSPPPGVIPSSDGAEVATPISVAEWMINNYAEHRTRLDDYEQQNKIRAATRAREKAKQAAVADAATEPLSKKAKTEPSAVSTSVVDTDPAHYVPGPVEALCKPGEVIFIPNGWWHTALNLTPSFAVTQNYVNDENIWNVCDFLATDEGERERNLELLGALESKLQEHHPDVATMVEEKKVAKEIARMEKEEAEERAKNNNKKRSSLWERLTA